MSSLGVEPWRARQLSDWIYKKGVSEFDHMSNLSTSLRKYLSEVSSIGLPILVESVTSHRDPVTKALLAFEDGQEVEAVLMRFNYGNSVCLSVQAGCRMACTFCASGLDGLQRNLSTSEMLGQVLLMRSFLPPQQGLRISHIVLMGVGEPLDNLDNVLKLLQIANAPWGLGISYRNMTLSTCGILDGITKLGQAKIPINLAVSLHAADDELRKQLMPGAHSYELRDLLVAIKGYTASSGRRVTIEYGLIAGVNDSEKQALKLATLLRGLLVHVNLIPINPVIEADGRVLSSRSPAQQVISFMQILNEKGIVVSLRREMGSDIIAACGQLRASRRNSA